MHLYPLIVTAICLQKLSSADLHQPLATYHPLYIATAATILHVALLYVAALLQTIAPTVTAVMPDKAPLVFGACHGCNALALRVSSGCDISDLKQVNS